MFKWPFNKYGFDYYIVEPIKQVFKKSRIIKTSLWDWDCVNIHEVVIDIFENYCNHYPRSFINQWGINQHSMMKDIEFWENMTDEEKINFNDSDLELHNLEIYVTTTRKYNQALLKHISDIWHEHYKLEWEDCKDKPGYSRMKESKEEMIVDWELDYDTLIIRDWKVVPYDEKDRSKYFNPLHIENALDKLDVDMAKLIIEYKDGIWD